MRELLLLAASFSAIVHHPSRPTAPRPPDLPATSTDSLSAPPPPLMMATVPTRLGHARLSAIAETQAKAAPALGAKKRLAILETMLLKLPRSAKVAAVHKVLSGQGLVAHNMTTLLMSVKRRHKWRLAVLLAEWAELPSCPVEFTTMHYNLLISACTRRAPRRALQLFYRMRERDIARDVVTHNTAMAAALSLDEEKTALAIFEELQASELDPTTIS